MTEAEWRTGHNLMAMLDFIWLDATHRKSRLFAIACCRSLLEPVPESTTELTRVREEIEIAEQVAEGILVNPRKTIDHIVGFHHTLHSGSKNTLGTVCHSMLNPDAWGSATDTARLMTDATCGGSSTNFGSDALRCIFGNPFRPVAVDPAWLTETAVGIARGIYDDRAFERLPILADALEEAGCDSAELLAHCREPGVHVRGCWVVDAVLGKS